MPTPARLTRQSLAAAQAQLRRACPVMDALIGRFGACTLAERELAPFESLAGAIIGQQLSAQAAATIRRRVHALLPAFSAEQFLAASPQELRAAGLSAPKLRYLTELARRVADSSLDLQALRRAPDAEAIATLVALPGIGQWTAQMFLIFCLRRPDVLALGDAGLLRAVRQLFGPDAELAQAAQAWKPYRSVASWYLWRSLDTE
ncbi:DNA-3-methyladenine glycosylase [Comamonas sp. NLF-1-9]|uniref:DNA-3-methyladenine glycosylase family protein n=1 Tax=Comamonas sp. NLF-1-9 TaxID=2853163 RepID=UPI001C44DB80|nr:DNA-3-methyladenine glycosylase 2 family protein [Comamonas sp. NLF-1-9]QXL84166.1 DNA-3-methyladenine glycosylase 2 family protein [Comamonas sp. NLF-1-9]